MTDPHHPQALAVDPCHKADNLAVSDIERRNDAISCLRHDVPRVYAYTLRFINIYAGPDGRSPPGPRFLR